MSALRVALYFVVSLQAALWIVTAEPRAPSSTAAHRDPPETLGRAPESTEPPPTTWLQVRKGLAALEAARGPAALTPALRRKAAALLRRRGAVRSSDNRALTALLNALRPEQRRILAAAGAPPASASP